VSPNGATIFPHSAAVQTVGRLVVTFNFDIRI